MAHPMLTMLVRSRVRAALVRDAGKGVFEAIQLASTVDADTINTALAALPDAKTAADAVGAIGDGSLIQKLIDFLNSDFGRALIALILRLITGV